MELWRYYRILRKRKWLILIGTLICVGIVGAAMKLSPMKWEAYTTVMQKTPSNEKVNIFNSPYTYNTDPKMALSNLAQVLTSQTVMERTAATLRSGDYSITATPEELLSTLDVSPAADSMVLVIKVQAGEARDAADAANVIATEFKQYYNEINYGGATRSKEFIESELPKAEKRLREVREEIRQYKESTGAVMLPRQTEVLVQQVSQLETNLSMYEVQSQQSSARVKSLDEQLKEYPEIRTASSTIQSNPAWMELKSMLAKQQIEMQRMLKDRTREHPEVLALQQQIEETEKKLAEAGTTILGSKTDASNPIRDSILQSYAAGIADDASIGAARSAAKTVIASIQPELRAMPAKEMELARLTVEEDTARTTYYLLRQKFEEAKIKSAESENLSDVQVIDTAKVRPADSKKMLKLILALILSPMLCSGIAFLLNYLDNSVKTPNEAEELLKLPVFAVVPMTKSFSLADKKSLSGIGTSYQMLSTNLWIGSSEMETRTILVASAEPNVGRSVTTANLAITLARDGARVILVDSDMRQPSQHTIFGIENDKGLSNVLAGQLSLRDAMKTTSVPDLLLITSGPLPSNPVRLLRSAEMVKLVNEINDLADFVIFDSPSGITFADSTLLAALVKNVVIVHAAGSVPRGAEQEFRSRLEQVDARLIGAVLNMVKPEDSHGYYHFRSAYGELFRDSGKQMAALPGSTTDADTRG